LIRVSGRGAINPAHYHVALEGCYHLVTDKIGSHLFCVAIKNLRNSVIYHVGSRIYLIYIYGLIDRSHDWLDCIDLIRYAKSTIIWPLVSFPENIDHNNNCQNDRHLNYPYIPLTLYSLWESRDISDHLRYSFDTPKFYQHYIAFWSKSILGVSAINPLVGFYDIHGRQWEVLFFCSVRTPHEIRKSK
jgi:hypothetical protein